MMTIFNCVFWALIGYWIGWLVGRIQLRRMVLRIIDEIRGVPTD